jgi:hypothetical protein
MSVVFPNPGGVVATDLRDNSVITDLGSVIDGGVVSLSPALIQDTSVFETVREWEDPVLGNVVGFRFRNGRLETELTAVLGFRLNLPRINSTSCVTALKLRVAIANWCTQSQDVNRNRRVDVWVGKFTGRFNDPDVQPVPFWPTTTVKRDLTAHPLPEACNGVGYEVAIEPTSQDIDAYLPIPGYWPHDE